MVCDAAAGESGVLLVVSAAPSFMIVLLWVGVMVVWRDVLRA